MPSHPGKQCNGCKGRYTGRYCPTCSNGWATRKPRSWAKGSSREWRVFRADWLANHPVCMDFGKRDGCTGVATVVCHKQGTDYDRDRLNPQAIEGQRCAHCDAIVTGRQGGRARWSSDAKLGPNNKSGVRGVSWRESTGKWWGTVRSNGKQISAGYFDTVEEAAEAVRELRAKLRDAEDAPT